MPITTVLLAQRLRCPSLIISYSEMPLLQPRYFHGREVVQEARCRLFDELHIMHYS